MPSDKELDARFPDPPVLPYSGDIQAAEKQYRLPPGLLGKIMLAESEGKPTAVSRAGAQGLMQLMPRTAEALGVKDSFNPREAIPGAAKHIRWLLDRYDDDIPLALAAYNAGQGNVAKYKGIPPFPETQNYIKKIMSMPTPRVPLPEVTVPVKFGDSALKPATAPPPSAPPMAPEVQAPSMSRRPEVDEP